jgi:O-antigen ligase
LFLAAAKGEYEGQQCGGQGWTGERLLALPALALGLAAIWRVETSATPLRRHLFYLAPVLLLALPLLQLFPVPWPLWVHLPGRQALAAAMTTAGVAPQWLHWSLAPFETERMLESLLVPAGLFMAAQLLTTAQRRQLLALVLAFAALNVFLGLLQLLNGPASGLYFYVNTSRGDAVGLFANRNHMASLLATVLPVATGMLVDRLRHRSHAARDLRVWLLSALLMLLAVGVTATRSRAAFALLMCSVVGSSLVVWSARRHGSGWMASLPWLRLSAVLSVALIVQYTLFALLTRLRADPLDDLRWRLAAQTLAVAAPAYGLGMGFGSFLHAYDQVGAASAAFHEYINHAHNDYTELWLEGGVPALLLMVLALYWLGAQLQRQWRAQHVGPEVPAAERDHHRGLALGAAFALLLLALHSAIDYPLRTLALQGYAALLAAVLVGTRQPPRKSR